MVGMALGSACRVERNIGVGAAPLLVWMGTPPSLVEEGSIFSRYWICVISILNFSVGGSSKSCTLNGDGWLPPGGVHFMFLHYGLLAHLVTHSLL